MNPQTAQGTYARVGIRLLLPIALLTFVNAIDRSNVSFAAAQMSRDIGLTPSGFGLGVSAFFVAYLLFQYPHAVLLRRWGIRPWLLLAVTLWGVAGVLMSRIQTPQQLVGVRFLLGVAEAGFAPGMTWYIARWTTRATRARAMAFALSAVPFSMVVGGPLCGWLLGTANPLELPPWRWMFLVSALPNFLCAVLAATYFVDRPSQARWLAAGEGARLEAEIAAEGQGAAAGEGLFAALKDARVWRCSLVWLLVMTGSYALVYWLPQLVRQLDIAKGEFLIGTLSALPQAALVAGLLLNARHSDRTGERFAHTAAGALLAGVALIIAVLLPPGPAVLGLLVVAGFGLGAAQGVFWTVPAALGIGGGLVPVGVIALISMAGTAGGIIGPSLLGLLREQTGTHSSGIVVLASLLLAAAAVLLPWRKGRT